MADIHLDVTAGRERDASPPLDDTPFRIALLGDFSGRGSRGDYAPGGAAGPHEGGAALAARRTWRVDRDDLEESLEEIAPVLHVKIDDDAPAIAIRFASLADFHPDALFERLPLFQALRDLRRRLKDPTSFAAAAREMSGEAPMTPAPRPPASGGAAGGSLLDDILAEASPPDAMDALAESGGDLYTFIQKVLKPHLVPNPDPRQADLVAQVDAAASATLRRLLHAKPFQELEALWRAADLLVRRIDTSPDLQLHLIDLSARELADALPAGGDPVASPLFQMLHHQSAKAPWALLAGAFTFGGAPHDLDRLAQLAAIGHLLQAPFIGGAHPVLAGAADTAALGEPATWAAAPDAAWQAFRATSLAQSVGLALPGFLMRAPYGKAYDECETIRFEELDGGAAMDAFVWGPPAFAVALVVGCAAAESGWRFTSGIDPDISGLPYVVVGAGPDQRSMPVAQVLMTDVAADRLMDRGLMPLATMKDSDRARLVRLQSLSHPLAALQGRWST